MAFFYKWIYIIQLTMHIWHLTIDSYWLNLQYKCRILIKIYIYNYHWIELYLAKNNNKGIEFIVFGIARYLCYYKENVFQRDDIGKYILKPSINRNLIESKISELISKEKKEVYKILDEVDYFSVLYSAQGINSIYCISSYSLQ